MPFIVPALAAIGGGSALAGGLAVAGTATSAYGAISQANSAKKAAAQAGNAAQVDINALDEQTRRIANQNAIESAELEKRLTPEVPELRRSANLGILAGLGGDGAVSNAKSMLEQQLGNPVAGPLQTPLLRDAIAKAKADLALGGELPLDVKNLVTRKALATAGTVAPGGLGLGRDITARDLGLTSLDLQNTRLARALQAGQQEADLAQFDTGTQFNNAAHLLNQIQLLKSISDTGFNRSLMAGQYGESIQRPVVGLDPSAVANVAVGNANNMGAAYANRANIAGAQGNNYLQLAGSLLGNGLMNYNNYRAGVGGATSYTDFLKNNPSSMAALGQR